LDDEDSRWIEFNPYILREIMSRRKGQLVSKEICSECGGSSLIHDGDSGEIICGNCGLVVTESIINKGPEWRAFDR
jgi:transcription initiation factor TFIIB